ncbi:MAG: sterol desaturase family protein [Bacteroidetes bacterium]|nr:sterol desaturase family protein [Bacteroidota bacterium]MBP8915098.1 sterol desaturase family protein [Chitinophagales bacterium]MBP9794969.1 sterol desaturase family protein [Chitinophagales bacterium]
MNDYIDIFLNGFKGYWNYFSHAILHPSWDNYFYWLIAISIIVWMLEIFFPWRKYQKIIRTDFWLDGFYMFFNFFLFSLIGYYAISNVFVTLFNDGLALIGITNGIAIQINALPFWLKILFAFILKDFIQWNIHRLLHRSNWLWQFHKVHHSVKQMGFAAHLRFHWMENVVYRTIQYIPLAMLGFGINDYLLANMISLVIGHFNHANINLRMGPLKYLLNNPQMHIWHHAKDLPTQFRYGINFGISLSIWDYIFKTNYIPHSGRDIELGFPDDEQFPKDFLHQELYPAVKKEKQR